MSGRDHDPVVSIDHLTEDDIIDAALGLMNDADMSTIGRHADACASCRARLREALADRERLAIRASASRRSGGRWPAVAAAAAAAAAAILLVALGQGPAPLPDPPGEYVIPVAPLESSKRSVAASGAAMDRLADGIAAYGRGDLESAIRLLETAELPEGPDDFRAIYLASALARRGDDDGARRLLESPQTQLAPREWRDRANWILYGLVRDDSPERARALLDELSIEGGEFREAAARELETLQ